jgi:hypothetical protein
MVAQRTRTLLKGRTRLPGRLQTARRVKGTTAVSGWDRSRAEAG